MKIFAESPSLSIAVLQVEGTSPAPERMAFLQEIFEVGDQLLPVSADFLQAGADVDAAVFVRMCGSSPLGAAAARSGIPCLTIDRPEVFHPYHAAFCREVERGGGVMLPADTPEQIGASVSGLRAYKQLKQSKLLVVNDHEGDFRAEEVAVFAEACRKRLGVEIIRRSVAELEQRAAAADKAVVEETLACWFEQVLDGPGEMPMEHLRQVAALYLGQRAMLEETGAAGITVDDIGGFLRARKIMPNVSYGPLTFDGFLAAEEGDIEVLAAELLLRAALAAAPTMSNIYLAYRDCFDGLEDYRDYTTALEREDFRQCLADDHVVAAHFGASGVLPPNMMEQSRYAVREALPSWRGQSMIAATPKLGQVVLARLASDASTIHLIRGEVDGRRSGERYGWYRGRWLIKLPSVNDFIGHCLHQHYAIGLTNGRVEVLEVLADKLLRLVRLGDGADVGLR